MIYLKDTETARTDEWLALAEGVMHHLLQHVQGEDWDEGDECEECDEGRAHISCS